MKPQANNSNQDKQQPDTMDKEIIKKKIAEKEKQLVDKKIIKK